MKRNYCFSFLCFLLIVFLSCSNDDENKFPVPTIPGIDIPEGEVQLVFRATAESNVITFKVEANVSGIMVNWGDNTELYQISSGEISYEYPAEEKSYIITIQAPQLTNIDLTHENAYNVTGLYAGECPEFMNLSFNKENLFEAFDLRACPQFGNLTMQINTNNFDLSGLSKAKKMFLYIAANTEIRLDEYSGLERLDLYYDLVNPITYQTLRIENSPHLTDLEIDAFISSGYVRPPYTIYLENLLLKAPKLTTAKLNNLHINGNIDLSKAGEDAVDIVLYSCDTPQKLMLSPATRRLNIHNGWIPAVDFHIEELDLSVCKGLEYITLEVLSGLKTIKFGDQTNLKSFWVRECPLVKSLEFKSFPSFERLFCFGNDQLESITLSDLSNLNRISLNKNTLLTELKGVNIPNLSAVDIRDGQFDENTILSLLNALPDELSPTGQKRILEAQGNPGYTENVRTFVTNRENWELKEYNFPNPLSKETMTSSGAMETDKVIYLKGER